MGSRLPLFLLALLAVVYPEGGSGRKRPALLPQDSKGSSLAPLGTSVRWRTSEPPFWVHLSPEFQAVPPGASVWLNCSSSCPLPEGFSLRTVLQRGKTLSGPGWESYQLLDVRAWSSDVYCSVTCAGEKRGATARINTYQRPHSVVLEPPVLLGSQYVLRCHVTHVFPVGYLVVTLRQGGRVIYSESLERFTGLDLANVTLTHELRTRPRYFWLPVTCHAHLNLDGLVIRSSSAPRTLTALVWNPTSKGLASTSIAALGGILLLLGAAYLRKCLLMRSRT